MNRRPSTHSRKTYTPAEPGGFPDLVARCPKCGGEIEMWSEEPETLCVFCGHKLFERETTVH